MPINVINIIYIQPRAQNPFKVLFYLILTDVINLLITRVL